MNVAVDPTLRRRRIATALIERLLERVEPRRAADARGAALERRRDRALRALRLPLGRRPPALLPGQRRGRDRHVAHARDAARHPGRRPRHMILALETSCDDTCAAVVTRAGEIRVERRLLAGRPRPLRRRRAGVGVAPPPRARQRGRRRRARARRRHARRRRADRGHAGPGARRRAAGRRRDGQGARGVAAAAARRRRPPAGPRRRELPRRLRAAVHRACSRAAATRCWRA